MAETDTAELEDPWTDAYGPSTAPGTMTVSGTPAALAQWERGQAAARYVARLVGRLTGRQVIDLTVDWAEVQAASTTLTEALGRRGPRRARLRAILHGAEPSSTTDLVRRILAALANAARHLLALGRVLAALAAAGERPTTTHHLDGHGHDHDLAPPGHLVATGPIAAHAPPCASISGPFTGEAIAA